MAKPIIDQRSTYPANKTQSDWQKVKRRAKNKNLHNERLHKAKLKRKEKELLVMTELQRLRQVESQFKQYRDKATKKDAFDYPEYKPSMGKLFYSTREWRNLRWDVISKSGGCCVVCGRNKKEHGVILHVDHIKPRSKYPELELVKSNMQVLCEECNIGKGAKKQTF